MRSRGREPVKPKKRKLHAALEANKITKGTVTNPAGITEPRPVRKLRHLTKKQLITIGNMVIQCNVAELERVAEDKRNSSALKVMLAALVLRVINKGDVAPLEMLLNRILGKVPDETKWQGMLETNLGPQVIVTMPSNGREAKLVEAKAAQAGKIIEAERIEEQEIPEQEPWL